MAKTPVRYARSGDITIAYTDRGDGPVDIVMVPGFVSNVGSVDENPFLAQIVAGLGRFARVVLFDKRGTGASERAVGIGHGEVYGAALIVRRRVVRVAVCCCSVACGSATAATAGCQHHYGK